MFGGWLDDYAGAARGNSLREAWGLNEWELLLRKLGLSEEGAEEAARVGSPLGASIRQWVALNYKYRYAPEPIVEMLGYRRELEADGGALSVSTMRQWEGKRRGLGDRQ